MMEFILQQERFYNDPISQVFNCDCMEFMRTLPGKFFGLAVVDPPYGINAENMQMGSHPTRSRDDGFGSGPGISTSVRLKGRLNNGSGKLKNRLLNKSKIGWDNSIPNSEYFEELKRVSVHQIIWGGNYFPLPPTRGIIAWDKLQPWDNFSQFELAWSSFDVPARLFKYSNTGGANYEKKVHPTQKPTALYKWLLKNYARPGDKIFDSHMGSQSSRIAAHEMGFDYWGCELDGDYFHEGNKRFNNYKSQLKIFQP